MSPLWLGVFVVLADWSAWRIFGGYEERVRGEVLAPRELAVLDSIADAVFPAGTSIGVSGREAGIADYVDRFLGVSQPRQRVLMRALFFLVEHATLLFPAPSGWQRWRRFSAQPPAAREALLEDWRTSRWFLRRLVFTSLRAVVTLGYFAHPEVLRRLELEPFEIESPVIEADLLYPPIGARRADIALGPEDLSPPGPRPPLVRHPLRAGEGA